MAQRTRRIRNKHSTHRRRRKRLIPLWVWFFFWVVGIGGVLYAADYVMTEGTVPRGVTVGGVDIGNISKGQAEQRLINNLGDSVRRPVTVKAGNLSSVIEPARSGLQVDWHATVEQAGKQPLNPITRIQSFFQKREVGIVSNFYEQPLSSTLRRVRDDLTREPVNASVAIDERGKPKIVPDKPGQSVDKESLEENVKKNWLNSQRTVHQKAKIIDAKLLTADAKEASEKYIIPATRMPSTFKGRKNVEAQIRPQDMNKILTFAEGKKGFEPRWDVEAARKVLEPQLASTEVEFRNANFHVDGDKISVIPHQDGIEIKWDVTLADLDKKLTAKGKREYPVKYRHRKATYRTEEARKAKFDDELSSFTTRDFSGPSGVNIRRVAEMVDGAIVLPGETFSLNGYTGPRGEAQGFVKSGIIIDGHAGEAVGGGISQFATTLYNASYFAGMEDVTHTPHSYYISRYPAGREATVFEGAIDLQFKNPFSTPVMIKTDADSDSVTVSMHGVKQVKVQSISGPRTNPTRPKKQVLTGRDCTPSSGAPGFTTTDTRVVRDLRGKELSRETTRTVYDPQPIVECRRPAPR